jgi:hypothetical protein
VDDGSTRVGKPNLQFLGSLARGSGGVISQ